MRSDRTTDPGSTVGGVAVRNDDGRRQLTARTGYTVAALILIADQLTKIWAVAELQDSPISLIGDFLRLRLTRNPGAAFSSFAGGGVALALVAVVVVVVIGYLIPRMAGAADRLALAFVMGGAMGNLADRIFRGDGFLDGAVVDFIDFSFWPTFNVADSGITIGVALMLVAAFLQSDPQP